MEMASKQSGPKRRALLGVGQQCEIVTSILKLLLISGMKASIGNPDMA